MLRLRENDRRSGSRDLVGRVGFVPGEDCGRKTDHDPDQADYYEGAIAQAAQPGQPSEQVRQHEVNAGDHHADGQHAVGRGVGVGHDGALAFAALGVRLAVR